MFRYQDLLKEVELFEKHGVETGSIGDSTLGACARPISLWETRRGGA